MKDHVKNDCSGCLYVKAGRYYGRIYYYEGGVRKSKSFATGVAADTSTPRKAKQCERAAQKVMAEQLATFKVPGRGEKRETQLFADEARAWFERQRGSKSPSTVAGYQYIVNDIVLYFTEINPVRTVDLTSSMVESYFSWERMRRQPDYNGPYKRKAKFPDGAGIENSVLHRATIVRSIL